LIVYNADYILKGRVTVMKNVLFNPDFFLLWVGRLISQIGDKFYSIALAWWILQKTNSPVIMGLLMVASALPGVLLAPLAGAWIDRWYRKPVIIIADVIRGLVVIVVAVLAILNILEVWHVFAVAVVISLGAAFYDPTVQAIVPQIVPEEELPKANSFNQFNGGISTVMGPVLGAVAVSFLGFATVFVINGLSYLVSAACGWFMDIPVTGRSDVVNNSAWSDVRAGMSFLVKQRHILIVIGIIGLVHFFYGSLLVSLPFLARELTGNGLRNLGYCQTLLGLGLVLGSIYHGLSNKKNMPDLHLFRFVSGLGGCLLLIGLLKFMFVRSPIAYLIIMAFIGIAVANASIDWQTILQTNTPNDMAGRVFGIASMMGNVSLPVAFGLFGILLNISSVRFLLTLSGALLVIATIILQADYWWISSNSPKV
jgi:MFS transporter, DHA3 family, macrolide efflux protein